MSELELSIVIPAFNEESTIEQVVLGHREVASSLTDQFEILVFDDGSSDRTGEILERLRHGGDSPELIVFRSEVNLGIPRAVTALYGLSRGRWIYFGPGDGQVPAEALARMWAVRENTALVVGRRVPRRDSLSRVLMAEVYSRALRLLFRLPVHDIDSVKLYRAVYLRSVNPSSTSNFFEAEILVSLCRAGHIVREVDVLHLPRVAGRAKGVTPWGVLLAVRDLSLFTARLALRDIGDHLRGGTAA